MLTTLRWPACLAAGEMRRRRTANGFFSRLGQPKLTSCTASQVGTG